MSSRSASVLGLLSENRQLREECALAAEQGRMVGVMADRYHAALERLLHLVVSPGDLDRDEIRAEGRRVIEEALNA